MSKIIIKGDFTLEGDIPALDLMCKRFKFIELEYMEIPNIIINQMSGIPNDKKVSKGKKGCGVHWTDKETGTIMHCGQDYGKLYLCDKCQEVSVSEQKEKK